MESSNEFLGTERIGKLMQKYAIPCIISLLVGALYNIVDQIFIANASYLGSYGNAANTVVFPLTVVALAIAVMIGDGCCAFVSISLGQNEVTKARRSVGNAVVMCLVSSIVLTAVYLIFANTILAMFGGTVNAETYHHSQEYFFYITLGVPFYMFGQAMNPIIRADGSPRFAMVSTLAGAVLNIILDPIFIFGLHMGVSGAAVATVISQMASCAFVLNTLFGKNMPVHITFGGYSWRLIRRVLTIGFTPFIIIAMDNVMIITMNAILQKYGGAERGDLLITCVTIAQSFMLVVTMPLGGITSGTQAVLAYNFGAGKTDRVKSAQKYIFILAAAYTTLLFVLARTIGVLFVRLFTADPVVAAEALRAIRIFTLAIIPLAFQYEIVDGFTGLGQVQVALPLSFFRKGLYFVSLFLLPAMFGAEAAFFAEPVSDIAGPVVSAIVYIVSMKGILAKAGEN